MSYNVNTEGNFKRVAYNNYLVISENIISIKTNINFRAISINHANGFSITSLLPNDYLIEKNDNKILILKFNNEEQTELDLFEYSGYCNISQVEVLDTNGNATFLDINRDAIVTWDNLSKTVDIDETESIQAWENLSTWYEKMSFDGRNNYKTRYVRKEIISDTDRDIDAFVKPTYEEKYEKVIPLETLSDELGNIIGGLYTKGNAYKIKGSKNSYTGYYHMHLRTKVVMTGKEHSEGSKELVKYTIRKV